MGENNIKIKYIDSHVHYNLKTDNPIADLENYIDNNDLYKVVLILNTKNEYDLFFKEISKSKSYLNNKIIVCGLNKSDSFIDDYDKICSKMNIPLYIKIHPRMNHMVEDCEDWYINKILQLRPKTIIIDDFIYGTSMPFDYAVNLIIKINNSSCNSNIVLAHSGGIDLLRHVMYTKPMKNVYYDLALTINYLFDSSIYNDMVWLIKNIHSRVIVGSDYTDFTYKQSLDKLKSIIQNNEIPSNYLYEICYDNIFKVFNII